MSSAIFAVLLLVSQFAQTATGELRVTVTDTEQLPIAANVDLVSEANGVHEQLQTDATGTLVAKRLPFGVYRITVSRDGFSPAVGTINIQSALPATYHVSLSVAPVQTQVSVTAGETLLDPRRTASNQRIGAEALAVRPAALPGRSLPDLVNTQPGWLLEANGVLHPRGSEYQTQYVVDGLPLTDNRSPAFAPELDADEVHSLNVLTGGYPAEYGRKLGGVIEVVTQEEARPGFHGTVVGSVGSFSTWGADGTAGYSSSHSSLLVMGGGASTDRYLDPPVEENFTNHGTTADAALHVEHEFLDSDRLGVILRYGENAFLVPNELVQQDAGQLQHRSAKESSGQLSYQHIFSADALLDVRAMVRDLSAGLTSNAAATPIIAEQDRGIRDVYVKGAVSLHSGIHEWKLGGDVVAGTVREQFAYQITDPDQFDQGTPLTFAFADRRRDNEQGLFVQDRIAAGPWTVNAGLRWDHYSLVVDRTGLSPRVSVAWASSGTGLVAHASYDRAFQTPAVENLLLASSPAVESLSDVVLRLPVEPSRGDFYEAGVTKAIAKAFRVDGSYFYRAMSNFADDDLLLNTGVSFPIAFRRAVVKGVEAKLDLPHWRGWSGQVSYSLMKGVGELPITGGLLLGAEAGTSANATGTFPVSQDQRHTLRGRLSWQMSQSAWAALAASYNSGLPVEFDGNQAQAEAQYGERIVSQVNFDTGRVRPSWTLNAGTGVTVAKTATRRLDLQLDVENITNRLNLINFAGLFSGTALAPPRSVALRVRAAF